MLLLLVTYVLVKLLRGKHREIHPLVRVAAAPFLLYFLPERFCHSFLCDGAHNSMSLAMLIS